MTLSRQLCSNCANAKCLFHGEDRRNGWAWNNRDDFPTITPSVYMSVGDWKCHCFVKEGRIEYLADSTHDLRGKSVEIPDWPF